MKEDLYPHESMLAPIIVFALGFIVFSYRFVSDLVYPPDPYMTRCAMSSTHLPASDFNWLVLLGLILMVLAITILVFRISEDSPPDIEKQIKQHEDAIAKLRGEKK